MVEKKRYVSLGAVRKSREGGKTTDIRRRGGLRTRNSDVGEGNFGVLLQHAAGARGCEDRLEIPVCVTSKVGAFGRRRDKEVQ